MDEREIDNVELYFGYTAVHVVQERGTDMCTLEFEAHQNVGRLHSEMSQNRAHHWHAAVDEKTGHAVRHDLEHWRTVAAKYNAVDVGYPQEKMWEIAEIGRFNVNS